MQEEPENKRCDLHKLSGSQLLSLAYLLNTLTFIFQNCNDDIHISMCEPFLLFMSLVYY